MVRTALAALTACLIGASGPAGAQGTSASGKRPAAGIFYLADYQPQGGGGERSPFDNPAVDGVIFRTGWMVTEPQSGIYDWDQVDRHVQNARRTGKILGLGVVAGLRSPDWFMSNPGVIRITTTNFSPTEQREITMPVPWDPAFLRKWEELLKETAARYDAEPTVAYVMIAGLGRGFEPFMARGPGDLRTFEDMGGLPRWIEGAKAVIDLYARYFQRTPFILTIHYPTGPSPEGARAIRTVMEYGLSAYPGRFGLRFTGLDAVAPSAFIFHRAISESSARAPVGYQMVWSSQGANAKKLRGSLEEALERGVALKAHFIEVYAVDCNNPKYAEVLKRASAALRTNAAVFSRR